MALDSTSTPLLKPKQLQHDENGELILMEGMFDYGNVQKDMNAECCCLGGICIPFGLTAVAVVLALGLCRLAICVPIGCCMVASKARSWRLYLTSSAIHYYEGTSCCGCSGSKEDKIKRINLQDIHTIKVDMNRVKGICSSSECVPTAITVILKPGCAIRNIISGDASQCVSLRINNCANAEEFVNAVNQQML